MQQARSWHTPLDAAPGVAVLVTRLSRLIYRRTNETVLGMSLKSFAVLNHLQECGSTPQQALGDLLCLDANNLVLLLNELERAGLATRRRDPSDRRRHIVEITQVGRKALRQAERGIETVEDEVLADLGDQERVALGALLARTLQAAPHPP